MYKKTRTELLWDKFLNPINKFNDIGLNSSKWVICIDTSNVWGRYNAYGNNDFATKIAKRINLIEDPVLIVLVSSCHNVSNIITGLTKRNCWMRDHLLKEGIANQKIIMIGAYCFHDRGAKYKWQALLQEDRLIMQLCMESAYRKFKIILVTGDSNPDANKAFGHNSTKKQILLDINIYGSSFAELAHKLSIVSESQTQIWGWENRMSNNFNKQLTLGSNIKIIELRKTINPLIKTRELILENKIIEEDRLFGWILVRKRK